MGDNKFLKIKITRHDEGIFLFIQSPKIENWIKSLSTLKGKKVLNLEYYDKSDSWDGIYGYPISDLYDELNNFHRWGDGLFVRGTPNFAFFRARGLGNGISFKLDGVYSDKLLEEYIKQAKKELRELYQTFLKPLEYHESLEAD